MEFPACRGQVALRCRGGRLARRSESDEPRLKSGALWKQQQNQQHHHICVRVHARAQMDSCTVTDGCARTHTPTHTDKRARSVVRVASTFKLWRVRPGILDGLEISQAVFKAAQRGGREAARGPSPDSDRGCSRVEGCERHAQAAEVLPSARTS